MPDPKVTQPYFGQLNKVVIVTSIEQLSLAEFSGELVRPKFYENDHRIVIGIWIDLEWKVNYSTILVFKVVFLCQKSAESF